MLVKQFFTLGLNTLQGLFYYGAIKSLLHNRRSELAAFGSCKVLNEDKKFRTRTKMNEKTRRESAVSVHLIGFIPI